MREDYENFIKEAKLNPKRFRCAFAFENFDPDHQDFPDAADFNLFLIDKGLKRAATFPLAEWRATELLHPGKEFDIVVDGAGHPQAALKARKIKILPFKEVGMDHIYRTGEIDLDLKSWQSLVRSYCEQQKLEFSENMQIVCVDFKVLYLRPNDLNQKFQNHLQKNQLENDTKNSMK